MEYIAIGIGNGKVEGIEPLLPAQLDSLKQNNRFGDLGQVLTKLAEYGYRIVPGIMIPTRADAVTIIMEIDDGEKGHERFKEVLKGG